MRGLPDAPRSADDLSEPPNDPSLWRPAVWTNFLHADPGPQTHLPWDQRIAVRVRLVWDSGDVEWATGSVSAWISDAVHVDVVSADGYRRVGWFAPSDIERI